MKTDAERENEARIAENEKIFAEGRQLQAECDRLCSELREAQDKLDRSVNDYIKDNGLNIEPLKTD